MRVPVLNCVRVFVCACVAGYIRVLARSAKCLCACMYVCVCVHELHTRTCTRVVCALICVCIVFVCVRVRVGVWLNLKVLHVNLLCFPFAQPLERLMADDDVVVFVGRALEKLSAGHFLSTSYAALRKVLVCEYDMLACLRLSMYVCVFVCACVRALCLALVFVGRAMPLS